MDTDPESEHFSFDLENSFTTCNMNMFVFNLFHLLIPGKTTLVVLISQTVQNDLQTVDVRSVWLHFRQNQNSTRVNRMFGEPIKTPETRFTFGEPIKTPETRFTFGEPIKTLETRFACLVSTSNENFK